MQVSIKHTHSLERFMHASQPAADRSPRSAEPSTTIGTTLYIGDNFYERLFLEKKKQLQLEQNRPQELIG
jgi:hypothetical protein